MVGYWPVAVLDIADEFRPLLTLVDQRLAKQTLRQHARRLLDHEILDDLEYMGAIALP